MANLQEGHYLADVDYTVGSPHLSHARLRERLLDHLRRVVDDTRAAGLPLTVLEIGAGHGGYTETALALGCEVTAVDMSGHSVEVLRRRLGANPRLTAVHDASGDLACVPGQFSIVLAVSVLHHIPDYLAFLDRAGARLLPGGSALTLQDPLWYARIPAIQHRGDRGAYLLWRLSQGRLGTGLASLSRRLRHALDESRPGDMVEYHVVREGVDEQAILDRLRPSFATVEVVRYWSHQSRHMQRLGERLGWLNTFGVVAVGRSVS